MSFDLQAFITAPSQELLNLAKKSDLLDIAVHYELTTVNKSMLKQEIKTILVQFLVDKEILDSSALSLVLVTRLYWYQNFTLCWNFVKVQTMLPIYLRLDGIEK